MWNQVEAAWEAAMRILDGPAACWPDVIAIGVAIVAIALVARWAGLTMAARGPRYGDKKESR